MWLWQSAKQIDDATDPKIPHPHLYNTHDLSLDLQLDLSSFISIKPHSSSPII